jgi:hypothetical protein
MVLLAQFSGRNQPLKSVADPWGAMISKGGYDVLAAPLQRVTKTQAWRPRLDAHPSTSPSS